MELETDNGREFQIFGPKLPWKHGYIKNILNLFCLGFLQVSLRSPSSFRLTRQKGKEVDISLIHQKQKMWIDGDEDGDDPQNENLSNGILTFYNQLPALIATLDYEIEQF